MNGGCWQGQGLLHRHEPPWRYGHEVPYVGSSLTDEELATLVGCLGTFSLEIAQ